MNQAIRDIPLLSNIFHIPLLPHVHTGVLDRRHFSSRFVHDLAFLDYQHLLGSSQEWLQANCQALALTLAA